MAIVVRCATVAEPSPAQTAACSHGKIPNADLVMVRFHCRASNQCRSPAATGGEPDCIEKQPLSSLNHRGGCGQETRHRWARCRAAGDPLRLEYAAHTLPAFDHIA